ncbi:EcsC family protein [Flavobacterium psychrotrophum]|uniref:EcsC family protein n=1 Tax=Flavobacterium psychrotrophum TaxID=2294119 RepID=UPI000E31C7D6|nr:EcsC family protein [Flavobacterium psychrotrophum]
MDFNDLIKKLMPPFADVKRDIEILRSHNPGRGAKELAALYRSQIRRKYTSIGVVGALPGVIPGLGTVAQIALEAGTISADVLVMLRLMSSLCYGMGLIYGQDTKGNFDERFTVVLGLWSGVVVPEKAGLALGDKITVEHFNQHITDRIRNRMNQKIGRKLVVKYGAKRGGVALGTLIPFGIGAAVGGVFNYTTMSKFSEAAENYFRNTDASYTITE